MAEAERPLLVEEAFTVAVVAVDPVPAAAVAHTDRPNRNLLSISLLRHGRSLA
jgi:hypothetical protein